MEWLYANWMKATPFLALYTFILVWLNVRDSNYFLYLIWLQGIIYWVHEFEEYVCPGGFLDFFNRGPLGSTRGDYTKWYFLSNGLVSPMANVISIIVGIIAQTSMMVYGFAYLVPKMKREGYAK